MTKEYEDPLGDDGDRRQSVNHDHAVRIALLEQGMRNITRELRDISKGIGRLIWIVGAAVIGALIQFALRGGLLK